MKKNNKVEVIDEVEEMEASGEDGYTAEVDIVGKTQLGFSFPFSTEAPADILEKNHWRERIPVRSNGNAMINPMALKKALDATAKKQLGTVPGKGKAKYGGYFKSGVMVTEELDLNVKPDKIPASKMFVALPMQGRHWKNFPVLANWKTHATIEVLDGIVKPEVLEKCLIKAGNTNGLGLYRPERGGYWGRFGIENFKVKKS